MKMRTKQGSVEIKVFYNLKKINFCLFVSRNIIIIKMEIMPGASLKVFDIDILSILGWNDMERTSFQRCGGRWEFHTNPHY